METADDYGRAVVLLIGLATAIVGWWHARRTGLAQAQQAVEEQRRILLELLETRLREEGRLWDSRLQDVDRRLRACEERWRRWQTAPVAELAEGPEHNLPEGL